MAQEQKVEGYVGVWKTSSGYEPRLKVLGELLDLGTYATAAEAAQAYDLSKLHAALAYGKVIEECKLNDKPEKYINNVAFQNLRENATIQECASLIKSGAILDQFSQRFRPVLRASSLHRPQHAPPQQAQQQQPKREGSPAQQGPQQVQQQQLSSQQPARSQSQSEREKEKGRDKEREREKGREKEKEKERGGGGGSTAAAEPAPARKQQQQQQQQAESAEAAPAQSKQEKGGGSAAAEEDAAKKRKARWVLYKGQHTVWISERTATGSSLSIPAFVKDTVFSGVEDGDSIVAVNSRSKVTYQWKYRNLRKESDNVDKHYLTSMKDFVDKNHIECGDVLAVEPSGDKSVEFTVHRAHTDFVRDFLAYMDTKPPSQPKRATAGEGGKQRGGGAAGAGAGAGEGSPKKPAKKAQEAQQQQQQAGADTPCLPPVKTGRPAAGEAAAAAGTASGAASPTTARSGKPPAAAAAPASKSQRGPKEEGSSGKPRKKGSRTWAQHPSGSGQYAVTITEAMLRLAQLSLPGAVWAALVSNQHPEMEDTVKAVDAGSGKGYPASISRPQEGNGKALERLGALFRGSSVEAGDVLAFSPGGLSLEGRAVVKYHVWKSGSEDAAAFKQQLDQLWHSKSTPRAAALASKSSADLGEADGGLAVGSGGKSKAEGGGGPGLLRSASSVPHTSPPQQPQGGKRGGGGAAGERGEGGAPAAAAKPSQQQQQQQRQQPGQQPGHHSSRRRVVMDSSSSEEENVQAAPAADAAPAAAAAAAVTSMEEDEEEENEGSSRQQPLGSPRRAPDASPKRKAKGEPAPAPAAKRPAVPAEHMPPPEAREGQGKGPRQQQQRHPKAELKQESRTEQRRPGGEHQEGSLAGAKRPAGAARGLGEAQRAASGREQQQQAEPAPAAAAAEVRDFSQLPLKKRMLLKAQAQALAAPSAGVSTGQSGGGSAHAEGGRAGVEGAGDSQGDSIRRRTAAGAGEQQGGEERGAGEAVEASPQGGVSTGGSLKGQGGYFGGDDIASPEDQALLTPTSPPVPRHGFGPASASQLAGQREAQEAGQQGGPQAQLSTGPLCAAGRGSAGRQTSPAEHSSGTAGDRPQLQLRGASQGQALPRAASLSQAAVRPGSRTATAVPAQPSGHAPAGQQAQQQECSAAVQPSGSAAMGSAGMGGLPLLDPHLLFNDEMAVVKEMIRLVDLTASAGKLTPELTADLKMGLMGLEPFKRWCAYSTLKPLYDVASWDKLLDCFKRVVPISGGGCGGT